MCEITLGLAPSKATVTGRTVARCRPWVGYRTKNSAPRVLLAVLVTFGILMWGAGAAAGPVQGRTLDTEQAIGLAAGDLGNGVFTQSGADADPLSLKTVVMAEASDLSLYVAVFAEPLVDPDAVAAGLLASVAAGADPDLPVLVTVFAPGQFGQATSGVRRAELERALLDAQDAILSGSPTLGAEAMAASLTASEGLRWGRVLVGVGVAGVVIGLVLLGTFTRIRTRPRRR